jgi:hypothetical protein
MKRVLLIASLATACGGRDVEHATRTVADLKSQWGPKVQVKLDKIVAAATAASGGELGALGGPTLALDFVWDGPTNHPNALAVMSDDVQSATAARAEAPKPDTYEQLAKGEPVNLAALMPHRRFTFQDDRNNHVAHAKVLLGVPGAGEDQYPDYVLDQFVTAKYLLVVTPGDVTWASLSGGTFHTGSAPVRAMLVEIDTATVLGGFTTTAENSDKVRYDDDRVGGSADERLDKDLLVETRKAIVKGVQQRWPGAKTPPSWGL